MEAKNEKYRVVKLKESIHTMIKHKAVDMKTSMQEIVERALLKFLENMEKEETKTINGE